MVDHWTLTYVGFDADSEGRRETLCTLGNGRLATRGAAPESRADGVHYPATYAAGCYNRLVDTVEGEQIDNESIVNLPNWLPLTFRAEDGPWLGESGVEILSERRELDLRHGVLTRRMRVRDGSDRTTQVVQRRFVHMRHPHLCGLQTVISPENWSGTLGIRSWLDANVENSGVARYRNLAGRHHRPVLVQTVGIDTVLLVVQTSQSDLRVAQAMRTRLFDHQGPREPASQVIDQHGRVGHELRLAVDHGQLITVDKLVATITSRDAATADPASEALERLSWANDFETEIEEHTRTWQQLWRHFRIQLDGRGEGVLRNIRLHLFHIVQTLSLHTADLDAGVPTRGLHGEAYRGHVLWDELFIFSVLNLRTPSVTRALLEYRYRRLPWARRTAFESGHVGAAYPWQSGSNGREESQHLHLNPRSGRWTPDPSHRQRHIGLAIAYNAWQYYQVTEDIAFMHDQGAEMIVEIARYFVSLATFGSTLGRYVIRNVMGPDEFHTGYPDQPETGVDNNAYTNVMTVWVIRRAIDALDLLSDHRRVELLESLRISTHERQQWEAVASQMYVPMRNDGIICQFDGYDDLLEFPWDDYRSRYGDIRRLDRILEAEGDSPNRYKASKQADVLMLFYLLSTDELYELFLDLGYPLGPEAVTRNVEYYTKRTSHGSTLSAVVHAWVLARSHRDQALAWFVEAVESDVADVQGGTTSEGIHLGAMAGSVDVLQRCFAGVETRGDTLRLDPYWPEDLGTLEFDIMYRGHALTLQVSGRSVHVRAQTGGRPPILLSCGADRAWLGPGDGVDFRARGSPG